MRKLATALAAGLLLIGCTPSVGTAPATVGTTTPVVSTVCSFATDIAAFDKALKAYDLAITAVDTLIDVKVIKPGSSTALTIASANDKVLAAITAAEAARRACNSTSYLAALANMGAGIATIRAALAAR